MADDSTYRRRLRSHRHSDSTSSEDDDDLKYVTRGSGQRYGIYTYTPEPVQRTLVLRPDDVEDEDEDSDYEEMDDYGEPVYRSLTQNPPFAHGEDLNDHEDGENESVDEQWTLRNGTQRAELKERSAGAASFLKKSRLATRMWEEATDLNINGTLSKCVRRLWRFVLRNSFMAVNVLWLLAPLCCFVIAILVPQYLTAAIQYADVLFFKVIGVNAGFDKGVMRSVVQEMVEMELVGINDQLLSLRQTVQSQELEIEALKLLHDTLRHAHDEQVRLFSIIESESVVNTNIEAVVAKHTEKMWEKFTNSTLQLQQDLKAAARQQSELSSVLKAQEGKMDSVQNIAKSSASRLASDFAEENAREKKIRSEINKWRDSLELELQSEMQRNVHEIKSRLSSVLQEEKNAFFSSVDAFRGLDATDPGILRVIEIAVQAVEIKKTGRVDHAALANGASVIYSERDLLHPDGPTPVQLLSQLIRSSDSYDDGKFTSSSFRHAPTPFLGQLLSFGENPWWLSRHNGRPETALSETMEMGSCWGIVGSSGRLSVKFAHQIVADAITIDHIPAQIAFDFSSAPNEFRILGISGHPLRDTIDFLYLGNFSYASQGPASQTFRLTSPLQSPIDGITLEVLSNHGNPEYTCLYRFRVHGQLA